MRWAYCHATTRAIINVTKVQLPAAGRGNRLEVEVADNHPAILDPQRRIRYEANAGATDLILTGQDPAALWEDPPPVGQAQKIARLAAAVRELLGRPIP